MWTRSELKGQAKLAIKPYYWIAVLVCLVAGILGGGSGLGSFGTSSVNNTFQSGNQISSGALTEQVMMVYAVVVVVFVVIYLMALILYTFVGSVITVGKHNFFIQSRYRGQSGGFGLLFSGFGSGHYLNIVKIMFLKGLYETLWTLLLIIPGIYKSYEYYMIPYLLAENPGMDCRDAFRLSKEMMHGNRFNTWVLEISFFGWYLLGALACGIGTLFVNPYLEATLTELYLHLKQIITPNYSDAQPGQYVDAVDVTSTYI